MGGGTYGLGRTELKKVHPFLYQILQELDLGPFFFIPEQQIVSKIYQQFHYYFLKLWSFQQISKFLSQIDEIGPILPPILKV